MSDPDLKTLRAIIRDHTLPDHDAVLSDLTEKARLSGDDRARIAKAGADLVRDIRNSAQPGLMEVFLAEYGLSSEEGVALMCLAEALLRVPDADTMDALIEDKIAPSNWGQHLGHSASPLVNASTWALMLTGKVLDDERPGIAGHLTGMIKRLGEPVIRTAVARAMKEMGRQFVLGETIEGAMERAGELEAQGYSYSYDMLGEAARTEDHAQDYFEAYTQAIAAVAKAANGADIRANPGISVKLSALYSRYEYPQRDAVMEVLAPRLLALATQAAKAQVGLNIDAEEADRLDISLDVIEAVLRDPVLAGWDGFGVVVQAYGPRAGFVIDWLYALASELDRKIMVRLVKGAYWDTEIKRAQVLGLSGFPVFTQKPATDISYIANARKLLAMTDRIYPQFATHNAHTVAAVLDMAPDADSFEFQRLHGMGERLHDLVLAAHKTRCRIYAPVGAHRDLLAYLVRRLLENGANSSFVNQIVDDDVAPEEVASDPFDDLAQAGPSRLTLPSDIFAGRKNSKGWDWTDPVDIAAIDAARDPYQRATYDVGALAAVPIGAGEAREMFAPADPSDRLGQVVEATQADVKTAIEAAKPWDITAAKRAEVLRAAADLYEENFGEIFAILAREAGKVTLDAIGELREAVDFLRYYAGQAERGVAPALGVFACISPWNFPLAIFTGQISAALAAGNAVIAKPAEQTPIIAHFAVKLLHQSGVPYDALQLLPGGGAVGAALTGDPRILGVCFTGSTPTAMRIHQSLAETGNPAAPLIAETGGINAMIVDSTALPEQAVRDIIASAFQSAGQRCSALRCLYVQEDIAEPLTEMLVGAMKMLRAGQPCDGSTDIGPIIDTAARKKIADHIKAAGTRVIYAGDVPESGTFIAPTLIKVDGISEMAEEIFGPVLHIATFAAEDLDQVIDDINATGYGLTFGLHTRIDDRVQEVVDKIHAGNIYVNRNQIGAVVGTQPFGGEGLSGTGPKAGGPHYLPKFARALDGAYDAKFGTRDMPGPTGEANRLSTAPRDVFLCAGPDVSAQIKACRALGAQGEKIDVNAIAARLSKGKIGGVIWSGDASGAREIRKTLAAHDGPILPLLSHAPRPCDVVCERHVCIDTTASGGNAQLLADTADG